MNRIKYFKLRKSMHKQSSILDIKSQSIDWIQHILKRSQEIQDAMKNNTWQARFHNKVVMNIFFEASTRTRMSFELALHHLGVKSLAFDVNVSSNKKGESLGDMMLNLEALGVSAFIVRHYEPGSVHYIDGLVKCPVVNAGDGINEHPTQALLDVFTLKQYWGDSFRDKKVLICGDIKHSRVAHSNMWALSKLGAKVYVTGPAALIPEDLESYGVEYEACLDTILPTVDAVNVLRIQFERQQDQAQQDIQEYRQSYGLTLERLNRCSPHLLILHPGPINRGVEIDSEVAESSQNVILKQVSNGICVRMACLEACLSHTE